MARKATKLTAAFVRTVEGPGKYYDEHGLFLNVKPTGGKSWQQRIVIRGKRRDLGLGGYPLVSLAEARQAAFDNRKLARAGGDPIAAREAGAAPTFAEAVERVLDLHKPTWAAGSKSEAQWRASLNDYAVPVIGRLRVDEVRTADVMRVLLPIWNEKRETARRVRQRIGAVMKWAVAQGYRQDNPAGDAIGAALPQNGQTKKHHPSLPHPKVAEAVARVRESKRAWLGTKLAFEFIVLTAARSGEVREARWSEIDLEAKTWAVPASRMKMRRQHRVPLSDQAVAVLREAEAHRRGDLVFPSKQGKTLSDSTLSKLLRELGVKAVPHGFRASFKGWCREHDVPETVSEFALAHVEGSATVAAYARDDLLEKRRVAMQDWADFLALDKLA